MEARLGLLRDELFEQAYALERQGRVDAADAVIGVAGRIEEWCSELEQSTVQVRVD